MSLWNKFKDKREEWKEAADQRDADREARRREEARRKAAEERRQELRIQRRQAQRQAILDILAEDKVPEVDWTQYTQFKITKNERLIYVFPDAEYIEQKTRRRTKGRNAGTSVRVAKGVSVRMGQTAGQVIEYDEKINRGKGTVGVSTKHVFFVGDERSFRVRMDRIVSVRVDDDDEDTVEIVRDRASGQPEFLVVGKEDAEFCAELIGIVPSIELGRGAPEMEEIDYSFYMPADTGDMYFE